MTPYVAVTDNNIVVAYYTLSSFRIDQPDLPEDERKELPGYPDVPATLLGRLAVDQKYRGQGIGEHMLLQFPGTPNRLYLPMKQVAELF